jgi:hypothetical protein
MARVSRPPGFDMTYKPTKATFLPPWKERLPTVVYFGIVCTVGLSIVAAPLLPDGTWLYQAVVVGDRMRVMPAQFFALMLFVSGLAAVMRRYMSGVIVHPDGIETREVLPMGVPRIKKLAWAQIDRVAIPATPSGVARASVQTTPSKLKKIRLDLWDGSHQFLPEVAKLPDLALMIERVALARAIPIEGGTGMVDELGSPFEDDET